MLSEALILFFLTFCYLFYTRKNRRLPPGPAGLPLVGYLPFLGPTPNVKISELCKKYGDIISVYFGQYLVVFVNDVELMKEIGKIDVFLGRNQLELVKPFRENKGLIFLEEQGWQEWRRFTLKSLRDRGFGKTSMEGLIAEQVQDILGFLKKYESKPLYMKEPIEVAVINSIWLILAGEKYDIEDKEKRDILKMINDGFSDQNILGIAAFLPWLARLFPETTGYNKALKCLGAPLQLGEDIMERHRKNYVPGQEKDFIDCALTKVYATTDPTSAFYGELGMENLKWTVLDIFYTGSDTVSSTLGWAFLFAASYPEVQRKVQEELDQLVGRKSLPSLLDKPKLVYTEATMLEVLRKSSMVPFGVMHTALEDAEFHGYFIPKRTILLWNLYGVHHDPKYWGDPENFRPERFINPDGTLRKDEHLVPFFTGKRKCPGDSLAINEFFMFFTGVLQNFHVKLQDESKFPYFGPRPGFILKPPEHELIFTERPL